MTGLVLKLGPKERILVNGVVIQNGDRRTRMNILTPDANILRLRDALHPSDANTPVKRVCYILQLVLSGDIDPADAVEQASCGINQLAGAICDEPSRSALQDALSLVQADKIYPALKLLRQLMAKEEMLLAAAAR